MTSYSRFIVIMGLFLTVSEMNGDFSRKSPIFPTTVFLTPLKGFPLELSIGASGQKTRIVGLPEGSIRFKIVLVI